MNSESAAQQQQSLPKISVVIPVLNSVNTIEKALQSVLAQAYAHTEIIVIDGGSTDGTVEIIQRYAGQIHYWHSLADGSCGKAINLGMQQATGVLIAQLMADDWFEPGTFAVIGQAYCEHPEAEVISCGGRIVATGEQPGQYKTLAEYTTPQQLKLDLHHMCFAIPAMSSRFLTKRLLDKIGLMDPFDAEGRHLYSADRELLIRAVVMGCRNVVVDHLGHSYFAHPGSATFGKNLKNQLKIYQEHMVIAKDYPQRYQLTLEDSLIFKYWYNDQSVRLFFYSLLGGNFKKALDLFKQGIQQSHSRWLITLLVMPWTVARKKLIGE
ncbi:MAG TPA: glycosyltransferase [Gammaproteobacteria bacterium]|jgi:glycosyltransferase involved in cell wall biosynthesis|nr:glycosyltransferase [Gammaproteobacteria bacterium]